MNVKGHAYECLHVRYKRSCDCGKIEVVENFK